jgi:hypothetical protein
MEWTEKIRQKLAGVVVQESLEVAVRSVLPIMRERIFDKGLDSNGQSLGTYSTEPIYLRLEQMARIGGEYTVDVDGSRYWKGGYAEYKRSLGYNAYNLRNFGVLMREFLSPQMILEKNRIKFTWKTERNELLGEIFAHAFVLSASEKQVISDVFNFELTKRLLQ